MNSYFVSSEWLVTPTADGDDNPAYTAPSTGVVTTLPSIRFNTHYRSRFQHLPIQRLQTWAGFSDATISDDLYLGVCGSRDIASLNIIVESLCAASTNSRFAVSLSRIIVMRATEYIDRRIV